MHLNKKNIIIFLGPSLNVNEASKILDADYRPPIKRGDISAALNDNPDIIGIIDGVFHQQPAVSHREILNALKQGVTIVGGASMGALRASELDDFGMVGIGYVYNQYKNGFIESDDDVAIVINPLTLEQLSDSLVSMEYNFKRMLDKGLISKEELNRLLETAKSIFYPKRTYDLVFKSVDMDKVCETLRIKDSGALKREAFGAGKTESFAVQETEHAKRSFAASKIEDFRKFPSTSKSEISNAQHEVLQATFRNREKQSFSHAQIKELEKFLDEEGIDIKRQDAIDVITHIKNMID